MNDLVSVSEAWARIMAKSTATNFEILMWTSTNASGTFELFVLSGILSLACNFIHCVFEEIEGIIMPLLEKGSLELPPWQTISAEESTCLATSRPPRKAAATCSVAPARAGRVASTVTGAGRPRKKAEAATFEPKKKGSFTLPERVSWPFLAGYPKKTLSESGHSFTYLEKGVKESGSRAFFSARFWGGSFPHLALLPFQSGELSPYVAKRPV